MPAPQSAVLPPPPPPTSGGGSDLNVRRAEQERQLAAVAAQQAAAAAAAAKRAEEDDLVGFASIPRDIREVRDEVRSFLKAVTGEEIGGAISGKVRGTATETAAEAIGGTIAKRAFFGFNLFGSRPSEQTGKSEPPLPPGPHPRQVDVSALTRFTDDALRKVILGTAGVPNLSPANQQIRTAAINLLLARQALAQQGLSAGQQSLIAQAKVTAARTLFDAGLAAILAARASTVLATWAAWQASLRGSGGQEPTGAGAPGSSDP
jgi:hypothetical protein